MSCAGCRILGLPVPEYGNLSGYLRALLRALWREGSNFSAKHPLGDDDWQWTIYEVLAREGLVSGHFDGNGELDDVDYEAADKLIDEAIGHLTDE